jgi:ABC-type nitrate/sulfonate/bicarbonate transport system substrate-binding protein
MIAKTTASRARLGTFVAVAVLILAFGASVTAQPAGAPKPLGSLVLGVGIDAAYASVVVAVKKGQMKKHGIDATIKVFPSGQEALEAVLTGQADFTGNGQYNIPLVAAKGGNIKIIAEYERSDQQFGAVGKSTINSPADLHGKKVGTQFGTSPDYYYHLYTRFYGLDESKITLVNLQFAQLVPALAKGDIDAFFAFEPHLTRALDSVPGAKIIHRSGQNKVMPLRVYAVVSQKVYSNKDLAV